MGHLVQISSLKTHGQKELLVCSITAAYLLLPQIAEEAQIDCRANARLFYISSSHKMTCQTLQPQMQLVLEVVDFREAITAPK